MTRELTVKKFKNFCTAFNVVLSSITLPDLHYNNVKRGAKDYLKDDFR